METDSNTNNNAKRGRDDEEESIVKEKKGSNSDSANNDKKRPKEEEKGTGADHGKHVAQFYKSSFDNLEYSKTAPKVLAGTYDILFHYGFCMGEESQDRTARGTATLAENDTGLVEFTGDNGGCHNVVFQSDFRVKFGCVDEKEDCWKMDCEAFLVNDQCDLHSDDDWKPARLEMVAKRAAFPWITDENLDEEDYEEGDIVKFQNLDEAEKLAKVHEQGPGDKPRPVFFVEPGDLVLHVFWMYGHGGSVTTAVVLREQEAK